MKDDSWKTRPLVWFGTEEDDAEDFKWSDAKAELEAAGYTVLGEHKEAELGATYSIPFLDLPAIDIYPCEMEYLNSRIHQLSAFGVFPLPTFWVASKNTMEQLTFSLYGMVGWTCETPDGAVIGNLEGIPFVRFDFLDFISGGPGFVGAWWAATDDIIPNLFPI